MNIEIALFDDPLEPVVIKDVLVMILDGIFCVETERNDLRARVPLTFDDGQGHQPLVGHARVKRKGLEVRATLEVFPQYAAWVQGRYPSVAGAFGPEQPGPGSPRPLHEVLRIVMCKNNIDTRIPPLITVKH